MLTRQNRRNWIDPDALMPFLRAWQYRARGQWWTCTDLTHLAVEHDLLPKRGDVISRGRATTLGLMLATILGRDIGGLTVARRQTSKPPARYRVEGASCGAPRMA